MAPVGSSVGAFYQKLYIQSKSAPEDGRICLPKHVGLIYDMIYLSTAIGLTPGGSSTVHIYTQTVHRTTQITTEQNKQQLICKSADRAPSLLVIPWHLPYN